MTKLAFLAALRQQLITRYGAPDRGMDSWAADPMKLDGFMESVKTTLSTNRNTVAIDNSPCVLAAWHDIGGKGKPTYKALRSLA